MATYLTPGLYYERVDSGRTAIPAIRTDVAAFVGVAARGPLHTPVKIHSWMQFQAHFGGFLEGPFLAYAVKGFFENGGDTCHVVRVAALVVATDTDPLALQPADRSYSIVLAVSGFVPGAVVTVSQGDVRQNVLLAEVDDLNNKLVWTHPLHPAFVVANPMSFETGAAAAAGVLRDAAGQPALRISAQNPGVWGNLVSVQLARESRWSTRTRSAPPQPADRASSYVESLGTLAPYTLVKVFQDQSPTPVEAYHVVANLDALRNRIIWDTPLEITFNLGQPIYFESLEFALSVYEQGRLREVFQGLSLEPQHARYAPRAVAEGASNYVRAEDLSSPSPYPDRLPDPGAANLRRSRLLLASGRDGTAALIPDDFLGDPAAERKTGLRSIEDVPGISTVAIPDIMMQPTPAVEFAPLPPPAVDPCLLGDPPLPEAAPLPPPPRERVPAFSLAEVYRMQQTLVQHCETARYRFALLDPPMFSAPQESVDVAEIQSWRERFDSKHAALYFPWLLVYDPLQPRAHLVRPVPPCGHVAGLYARTDFERGVHVAPANQDVRWAQDVTVAVDAATQGVLNPAGIDAIRAFAGRGLLVYGARTVSSNGLWIYVNVRRLMSMIEESLETATQWAVFEPNDASLQQKLKLAITTFLEDLWKRGALQGRRVEDAFFVNCGPGNNTPAMAADGQLLAEIGVAPVIPAEFVIFRIGRAGETLETED